MKWLNCAKINVFLIRFIFTLAVVAVGTKLTIASDSEGMRPIADAGLPLYAGPDPIVLDGTGSYDPDESGPLSYTWRQISGPSTIIKDANTATPLIGTMVMVTNPRGGQTTTFGGFTQKDEIQECEFELIVSDGELTSTPDTVKVIIVPDFGVSTLRQENPPFDSNKPTILYFGGGDCLTGGGSWNQPAWSEKANIISFPNYYPDSGGGLRTYYRCGDIIIVYLSSVAPDYKQPIQTMGHSTGGMPAIDVGLRLNLMYRDPRYAVNRATLLDGACRSYSSSIAAFLESSVDSEQCWIDTYRGTGPTFYPGILNIQVAENNHQAPRQWYQNSLTSPPMNEFNGGIVAGAFWSVIGPGKNLQLASTPGVETYEFTWYGNASSGYMDFYDEPNHPGRLPEPVTLFIWHDPWLAADDPNGILLTCQKSQNAVNYQLLSGSDPYNISDYNIVAESNSRAVATAAMLPSTDTWWTIKVRDEYGSTIYADPIRVDSQPGPDTVLIKLVDFNRDKKVNLADFANLAQHWHHHEPSIDIVPARKGDRIVDVKELMILAQCWLKEVEDPTLIAHWKLDEREDLIAHDSAGDYEATLYGDPLWQPDDGIINGALLLDGDNDYVSTPIILNPYSGPFSVFAWVKSDVPGKVIISQRYSSNWLLTDSSGKLISDLKISGTSDWALISQAIITDGNWHRIGFVRDGTKRILYVDDVEVASDKQEHLASWSSGLNLGAGKLLEPDSFFSGMIDDVRIYNRAITP